MDSPTARDRARAEETKAKAHHKQPQRRGVQRFERVGQSSTPEPGSEAAQEHEVHSSSSSSPTHDYDDQNLHRVESADRLAFEQGDEEKDESSLTPSHRPLLGAGGLRPSSSTAVLEGYTQVPNSPVVKKERKTLAQLQPPELVAAEFKTRRGSLAPVNEQGQDKNEEEDLPSPPLVVKLPDGTTLTGGQVEVVYDDDGKPKTLTVTQGPPSRAASRQGSRQVSPTHASRSGASHSREGGHQAPSLKTSTKELSRLFQQKLLERQPLATANIQGYGTAAVVRYVASDRTAQRDKISEADYQALASGEPSVPSVAIKVNLNHHIHSYKEEIPTDGQRVKNCCFVFWSVVLGMIAASPTAINTFAAAVYIIWLIQSGDPKNLRTVGEILAGIYHAEWAVLSLAAWIVATAMCAASEYVNYKSNKDFLLELGAKSKQFGIFLGDYWHGRVNRNWVTNAKLYLSVASLGAAIGASIIAADAFASVEDYYVRNTLNVASMITGFPLVLASRFVASAEVWLTELEWGKSKQEVFLARLLARLQQSALDLAKTTLQSEADKLETDPTEQTTTESLPQLQEAANNTQNIDTITTELYKIFAEFNLTAPVNLKEIVRHGYADLNKILEKNNGGQAGVNPAHFLYIAGCALSGFAAFSEKFATLIPRLFSGRSATAWNAFRFFIGGLFSTTSGLLYGITAKEVFGSLKAAWAIPSYWYKTKTILHAGINFLAAGSMYTVGIRLVNSIKNPPILSFLPQIGPNGGPWYGHIFPAFLACGAWSINARSCARMDVADVKTEQLIVMRAQKQELLEAGKYPELSHINQTEEDATLLGKLRQALVSQRKANTPDNVISSYSKMHGALFREKYGEPELEQPATPRTGWFLRLGGTRGE